MTIMKKSGLIDAVAEKTGMKKSDAHDAVEAFIKAVQASLVEGDSVSLVGFGTFKLNYRAPRQGRNPKTNEPVEIPACNVPSFTAGKSFREAVNNGQDIK